MKDPIAFIVSMIGLIVLSIYIYIIWVIPQKYVNFVLNKRKSKFKKDFPFLPNWFVSYVFFFEKPKLIIWVIRIAVIFGILICLSGVIVGIRGPF